MLEKLIIHDAVSLCDACARDKVKYRRRSIPSSPQTAERRHSRVIPSVNKVSLDKLTKISFRHYRVRNIESRKFSLFGFYSVHKIEVNIVNYPFIKRSVIFKFY